MNASEWRPWHPLACTGGCPRSLLDLGPATGSPSRDIIVRRDARAGQLDVPISAFVVIGEVLKEKRDISAGGRTYGAAPAQHPWICLSIGRETVWNQSFLSASLSKSKKEGVRMAPKSRSEQSDVSKKRGQ